MCAIIRTPHSDGIGPCHAFLLTVAFRLPIRRPKIKSWKLWRPDSLSRRVKLVNESISGSVAAKERPGFIKLIDRMESGDVLVVTKLDRLGRNAMDVRSTVEQLASAGVRVHCLALGGVNLTSPAGKMTMQVIAAVAEFERDLLIERTQSGIVRAKAAGKQFGRPPALNAQERATVVARLGDGASIAELAREFKTTRQTIMRVREAALKLPLQQIA